MKTPAELRKMPLITQELLENVMDLLETEKPMFRHWGRDQRGG